MDISKSELDEIIHAYDCGDFTYDGSMLVEPDTELFFYHDNDGKKYVLLVADFIGSYTDLDYPDTLCFDYYEDKSIDIAVKRRILAPQKPNVKMLENSVLFERL